MRKIINSFWTSAVLMAMSAVPVLAQTDINLGGATPKGAEKLAELQVGNILSGLVKLLIIAAAVLFFVWLVLGGIRWITSGGDKAKTEEARNQITAALVGLVVVFSAWAIAQLIKTLFGFDILDLKITALK